MKVGFLTEWLSSRGGGLATAVRALAVHLNRSGRATAEVFGYADAELARTAGLWRDVPLQAFRPLDGGVWGWTPKLSSALRRSNPDLLHGHGLWSYHCVVQSGWSARSNRPYVVSPHGMLDAWALNNSRWKKRVAARLFGNRHLGGAACIHAVSEAEARSVRAYGLSNPIAVIPNGVDPPGPPGTGVPPWAGQVPAGARVMLFLGRLHPKKGLPRLLEAWHRARARRLEAQWHLVIAGWDQAGHQGRLESMVHDLGLDDTVTFAGPQFGADKDASLRRADAFVLPSYSEGLPMSVLEAWAYGLPVLMTDACNLPEGFARGAALELPGPPEGMADLLESFARRGDAERAAMGAAGRGLVDERFAWPKVAGEIADLYDWIVGGGRAPPSVRFH